MDSKNYLDGDKGRSTKLTGFPEIHEGLHRVAFTAMVWFLVGTISQGVLMFMWERSTHNSLPVPLILSGICLAAMALLSLGRNSDRMTLSRSVSAERQNLAALSASLKEALDLAHRKQTEAGRRGEHSG